jgi:hypothetical protein
MPGSLITLTGVRGALFPFQGAVACHVFVFESPWMQ